MLCQLKSFRVLTVSEIHFRYTTWELDSNSFSQVQIFHPQWLGSSTLTISLFESQAIPHFGFFYENKHFLSRIQQLLSAIVFKSP